MRYRCRAESALIAQWAPSGGAVQPHQLLASPAVIFNRKDARQDAFLAKHLNLKNALYPRHFVPAVDAFDRAVVLGMGWGMVHDQLLDVHRDRSTLAEVLPGRTVDVALYWQH